MSIEPKINHFSYSYANAFGCALKQPIFKLVSNIAIANSPKPWESQVIAIIKVAAHCFIAFLFIIPAGLCWYAGKAISHFSTTSIDEESLHLAPPPIEVPQETDEDKLINLHILSEKFNQLNIKEDKKPHQTSTQTSFARLCDWTAKINSEIYPDNKKLRDSFCTELSLLLRGIVKKLNSGEISKDKERDILMNLAEASTRCYPTWLEVANKLFAELSGRAETPEIKLLRCVQEYKETLILEFSQQEVDAQWHALNFVRNILGNELGLNIEYNKFDPYAGMDDPTFGRKLTKWIFMCKYTNVNQMISAIQNMINSQKYDSSYFDYLVNIIKEQGLPNPTSYVGGNFYDENYKITKSAVHLMLKTISILK